MDHTWSLWEWFLQFPPHKNLRDPRFKLHHSPVLLVRLSSLEGFRNGSYIVVSKASCSFTLPYSIRLVVSTHLKNMSSSIGILSFPIFLEKQKSHVPVHQPARCHVFVEASVVPYLHPLRRHATWSGCECWSARPHQRSPQRFGGAAMNHICFSHGWWLIDSIDNLWLVYG